MINVSTVAAIGNHTEILLFAKGFVVAKPKCNQHSSPHEMAYGTG